VLNHHPAKARTARLYPRCTVHSGAVGVALYRDGRNLGWQKREGWLDGRLAAKIEPTEVEANEPQYAYGAENCDSCGCLLIQRGLFVDGCRRGQLEWANMCADCFEREGDCIGWGRGQIYARRMAIGGWLQVFDAKKGLR
jgi:hypothetical protein